MTCNWCTACLSSADSIRLSCHTLTQTHCTRCSSCHPRIMKRAVTSSHTLTPSTQSSSVPLAAVAPSASSTTRSPLQSQSNVDPHSSSLYQSLSTNPYVVYPLVLLLFLSFHL